MIQPEQINKNSLNRYLNTTPMYSDFRGGLNKVKNQAELDVNELFDAKNVMFNVDMGVVPRYGVAKLIDTPFPQPLVSKITGLYQAKFKAGNIIFACGGAYIYAWRINSWVQIIPQTSRSEAYEFSFTMFDDKLIICDGVNIPLAISYDGTNFTVTELDNAPADVRSCKFVISWYGRLLFSLNGTNKIYFTDINNINSFPVNGVISIGGVDDSEQIMSISPLFGNLIIFKRNSIYQLYGNSLETFTVNLISNNTGCLVEKCSTTAEGYVYFFGNNGIWRVSNSFSIEYISNKILPFFQYFNYFRSGINKPVIIYNPFFRQVWLVIGYAFPEVRDRVIVYDIVNNCFSYYEYYKDDNVNLNPLVLAHYTNSGGVTKLIGTNDKYVYEYDVLNYDKDDGNVSYAEIETKYFNLGDPLRYKSLKSYLVLGEPGWGYGINNNSNEISYFDFVNNTYSVEEFDLNYTRGSSTVLVNNKAYIIGGYEKKCLNKLRIYDLSDKVVSYGADMPIPLAYHSAVHYNNKIYVFGGYNGYTVNSKVLVYDIPTNSWQVLSDSCNMPTPREFIEAHLVGDNVYILGGHNSLGVATNKNECFNLTTLTWTTKTNLPRSVSLYSCCVFGDKIYIFGGYPISSNGNKVVIYDTTNDSYEDNVATMPVSIMEHKVYKISNQECLIVGGYNLGGYRTIYKFDIISKEFTLVYSMPYEKYWFSNFIYGNKVYLVGGNSFNNPKIIFKVTEDLVSYTTYETGLVVNKLTPIPVLSNSFIKFVSVRFKIMVNYGYIRLNSFSLDYFMWHRRP